MVSGGAVGVCVTRQRGQALLVVLVIVGGHRRGGGHGGVSGEGVGVERVGVLCGRHGTRSHAVCTRRVSSAGSGGSLLELVVVVKWRRGRSDGLVLVDIGHVVEAPFLERRHTA